MAATAIVTAGCSAGHADTEVAGNEVAARNNNSKTGQSYLAGEPGSEETSVSAVDARAPSSSEDPDDDSAALSDAGLAFASSNTPSAETTSASGFSDAGAVMLGSSSPGAALGTETAPDDSTSETSSEPTCRETAGLCDPIGECALSDCDFENTGKSCGYTPKRTYPFMCVSNADYAPYRPCDSDDVCAPGSVCISKAAWLKDGSYYRRSATICRETCRVDTDCGEGGWCAQATDDNNEVIPDLRVCHRHCSSKADCYVGEGDEDIRCSNSIEGAPSTTDECSRYNPPAVVEPVTDPAPDASESTAATGLSSSASLSSALRLSVLQLRAGAAECGLDDDCPDDHECIDHACFKRCKSGAECGDTECVVVNGAGVCGARCEKPEGAACGLWPANCGCGAGETCHLGSDLEPTCAEPGPTGAMSRCNTAEDCDAGLSCIAGLCRPLCDPEAHPCGAVYGECLLSVSREGDDVYACAGSCDPIDAPNCGEGAVCLPGFDEGHHHQAMCVAERKAQKPRKRGEACLEDYDCATGLGCAADDGGTCQSWCRNSDKCSAGQTCKFDASSIHVSGRFGISVDDAIGLCSSL